jgi:type I restriction enzyme S subunit
MATQNKTSLRGTKQSHDATVNNKQIASSLAMTHKDVPKLRFKEFVGDWEQKKLGSLVNSISSGKIKPNSEGEFLVYGSTGVIGKSNQFTHEGEYILIARVGANAGKINKVSGKYAVTDNTLIIDSKKSVLDNSFTEGFLEKFNLNRLIFGSGQPLITGGLLKGIKFNLPKLPEQQKIANFLTAVDTKLQQLSTKKEKLSQYKKGVMQQLFSQQLRFKADDGSAFPDWEEKELGEVLDMQVREIPKPKENYLAIGIRSHVKGTFQKPNSDPKKIAMEKLFVVKENDLIVNITFAWEGAIAIVKKEDEGGLVSHRFPTYTFKDDQTCNQYFKQIIIDKKFRFTLDLISPGGAGRNRVLSKKEFIKIKWSFPCVKEQQKTATYLSAIDAKIAVVQTQISNTQAFKKGLLQQLFV